MYPEAIAEYQKAQASLGETPAILMAIGYANAKAGDRAAARKALEELRAQSKRSTFPRFILLRSIRGLEIRMQVCCGLRKRIGSIPST